MEKSGILLSLVFTFMETTIPIKMFDKQMFPSHSSVRILIHSGSRASIQQTLTESLRGARYDANYKDE